MRCEQESVLAATLAWYQDMASQRPGVPLGIVYAPGVSLAMFAECEHVIRPLLSTNDLIAGAPPIAVVEQLRDASVEGRIMEEFVSAFGEPILRERRILTALIARGVAGGTLDSTARDLQCSQETIRLHLAEFGIKPGRLLSHIRVRAYELRKKLGVPARQALEAGGWYDFEALRKVARRQKDDR